MAKRKADPWFKFFPADWMADVEIKSCSRAARSLVVDLLCIMHRNSPRRGYLLMPDGSPATPERLSPILGDRPETIRELLAEIVLNHALGVGEDGIIYSRRMTEEARRSDSASLGGTARQRNGSSSGAIQRSGQQIVSEGASESASKKPANASAFSKNMSSELLRISDPLSSEKPPDPEGVQGEPDPPPLELLPPEPEPEPQEAGGFQRVSAHYRGHHPKAKPGEKERRLYAARRKEGYSDGDLCLAIDGCHLSPFHSGENERRQKYQSLELILRDSSQVAKFIELALTGPPPPVSEREMRSHRAREAYLAMLDDEEEQTGT